jgi:hypothetical protein
MPADLFTKSDAEFSADRLYRYTLSRRWDDRLPTLNFVMLNPSVADEVTNDPTIERCERRARAMGYGALIVTNLFALRSTDPAALYTATDPVGTGNDAAILETARAAGMVICAWGTHGALRGRGGQVTDLLMTAGISLYALELTIRDEPKHPLYISYDVQPSLWRQGDEVYR